MNFQKYQPLLETLLFAIPLLIIHSLLLHFFGHHNNENHYTLVQLYGFFSVCSLVIIFILIIIKQKNINSVGNAFMLLTCLKILIAYALLHPILNEAYKNVPSEKINFFVTFAIFLTIETLITIRLVNKK